MSVFGAAASGRQCRARERRAPERRARRIHGAVPELVDARVAEEFEDNGGDGSDEGGEEDDDQDDAELIVGVDASFLVGFLGGVDDECREVDEDELALGDGGDQVVVVLDVGEVVVVDGEGEEGAEHADDDLRHRAVEEDDEDPGEEDSADNLEDREGPAPRLVLLVDEGKCAEGGILGPFVISSDVELPELNHRRRVAALLAVEGVDFGEVLRERAGAAVEAPKVGIQEVTV
mmetsp:Transcript_20846/g.65591  ORF Transcript_20846/g.65591 Transcript_20846/m.65591 type:complete len:233 (+) Transcript_20846:717-1415(+)